MRFHPSKLNIVCAGARITEGEERRGATRFVRFNASGQGTCRRHSQQPLQDCGNRFASLNPRAVRAAPAATTADPRQTNVQATLFGENTCLPGNFFEDREIEELSLPQVLDRLKHSSPRPGLVVTWGICCLPTRWPRSCGMVDLLTQPYDVALMNPPYGKMPEACQDYCKGNRRKGVPAHYPDTGNNLYAAFMEKSVDLIHVDCFFVGMITSQTYMNLRTFKKCRRFLNSAAPPELLCDTGYDVLDGAKVITATTVLRKQIKPTASRSCIAFRMSQEREEEKESIFSEAVLCLAKGRDHPRVFRSSVATFALLPTSVYSYWVPSKIAAIFAKHPPLDRDVAKRRDAAKVADSKQGLATGDNPQFVRFFWEVPPDSIVARSEETARGAGLIEDLKSHSNTIIRWVPFTTGGWLRSFQDDLTCVINWTDDGNRLRQLSPISDSQRSILLQTGLGMALLPSVPQ